MGVRIVEAFHRGYDNVVDDGVPEHKYGVRYRANTYGEVFVGSGMELDIATKVAESLNAKYPNGPKTLFG